MVTLGLSKKNEIWRLLPLWIGGGIVLCVIAWVGLWLDMQLSTVGFCMFIAIVVLSTLDSFISSAVFSIIGALLLNYFFTQPIYSLAIARPSDLVPLAAFLVSSITITSLVRRIRESEVGQREQARLLELTHDAIFVRNCDGVITFWNHAAEQLYGWSRQEAVGTRADQLLNTAFPVPRDELQRALLSDGHWEGELIHTRRDGTPVIVSSRWTLHCDTLGRPLVTLESNNDITERRRAEDQLQRSQAQYLAEAQRLSNTGSFGWNVTTGEVFWSAQAFSIFEYDATETPTLDMVRRRVHPEDLSTFEQLLSQVGGQDSDFNIELRLRFPDARIKRLHIVARVGPNGQPDTRQFIGAVMDVTVARAVEEKLRQALSEVSRANRVMALGELSASIAHEVGQPLTAIVTNAEACGIWMKRQPPNLEEIKTCLSQISKEGTRAAEIVQRIRRLVKGAPAERAPMDINEVIEDSVSLIRRDVERQGGSFQVRLAAELPLVAIDRIQLQQVLINVALNATQAMAMVDGERKLAIESHVNGDGNVMVCVRDSGPGIRDEDLPHLFEPFFTTRSAGMGMGLAICTSILESHGGRIEALNNVDGTGATFRFMLPVTHYQ